MQKISSFWRYTTIPKPKHQYYFTPFFLRAVFCVTICHTFCCTSCRIKFVLMCTWWLRSQFIRKYSFSSFVFFNCAFSYASSKDKKFCRSSCIVCRQRVSPRCVKTCDTSDYWTDWKSSCTGYIQRAFLQCVWACACWEQHLACKNSYTAHIWKAFLLNEWTCVSWDSQLVRRSSYTVCNWKVSLLNGLTCVSWGYQLLCRSSCIACTQKVSRRCAKTWYTSYHWNIWKINRTGYIKGAFLHFFELVLF